MSVLPDDVRRFGSRQKLQLLAQELPYILQFLVLPTKFIISFDSLHAFLLLKCQEDVARIGQSLEILPIILNFYHFSLNFLPLFPVLIHYSRASLLQQA